MTRLLNLFLKQRIFRLEQLGTLRRDCPGCREMLDAPDPATAFAPRHTASSRCRSGQRAHCTCDTCF